MAAAVAEAVAEAAAAVAEAASEVAAEAVAEVAEAAATSINSSLVETVVDGSKGQKEAGPALKAGVEQIQNSSISIEISSTIINEPVEKCSQFSMRGFVAEVRKKNSALCSPFLSDGDVNGSDTQPFELPPLETRYFRWWRCSACLKDCDSAQGTCKDIVIGKGVPSLREGRRSRGLSNLYDSAAAKGINVESSTLSKGVMIPFNAMKRLQLNDAFQGASKKKMVRFNEVVMLPFNARTSDKEGYLQKGGSSRVTPKGAMGPPKPKPNARLNEKGETSTAAPPLCKKRNNENEEDEFRGTRLRRPPIRFGH